jgi:hypothetical protein
MTENESQFPRRSVLRLGSVTAGAALLSVVASRAGAAEPGAAGGDGAPADGAHTTGKTAAAARAAETSYNGWPIGTPGSVIGVAQHVIPGTTFSLPVRSGNVATVLMYVAGRFHREVEPLQSGQLFGYGYRRNVNNPSVWSNHASGTAIDLNASLHPNTVKNSFSAAEVAAVHRILTFCGGVIAWGGDYTRTVDAMHFEINVDPQDPRLPALAARIRGKVVSLRARINARLVTADKAGASPLIANRTAVGPWEQFDLVDRGAGNVALRAHANGRYVCADHAGASPLIANRTTVGPWETFALLKNPDGSRSLRALANGRLVTAETRGTKALIANRTAVGPWEKFDVIGL